MSKSSESSPHRSLSLEQKVSLAGVAAIVVLYGGILVGAAMACYLANSTTDKILATALTGGFLLITFPITLLVQLKMLKIKRLATHPLLEKIQSQLGGEIVMPTFLYFAVNPGIRGTYQGTNFEIKFLPSRVSRHNYLARKALETSHAKFGDPRLNNFELVIGRKRLSFRISIHLSSPQKQKIIFMPKLRVFVAGKFHTHHNSLLTEIETTHHCVCDNSTSSLEFLNNADCIASCEKILSANSPFVSKLELGESGVWWLSPMTKQTGAAELTELIKWLNVLVQS